MTISFVFFLSWFRNQTGSRRLFGGPSHPNREQLESSQEVSITTDQWSYIIPLLSWVLWQPWRIRWRHLDAASWQSLPFTTLSWHCQVSRAIHPKVQFPHKDSDTFTACVRCARWAPRVTSVSAAGFQPDLESPSPLHMISSFRSSQCPSKPKISLCCISARGNVQLLEENATWFLAVLSFGHTSLTSLQGLLGVTNV